jgi:hypothetical protein
MHACWILLCMSLNLLSYASLLNKEGTGKSTKSKGGLEGSIPWPVGGWGCYTIRYDLSWYSMQSYNITEKHSSYTWSLIHYT